MNIGAVIQARFSSTRLPGKVLKELPPGSGVTVLEQVIRRLKRAKKIDTIIVATTREKKAKNIVNIAKKEKVKHFIGETNDVLSRYYGAARENALDIIIRITSDCPCIDPEIVDLIIKRHLETGADYTSNTLERTFPRGFDTEVFSFTALEKAYKNASEGFEKEHVTPYIYRHPKIFKITQVKSPKKLEASHISVTLDTGEDYALLSQVFDRLYRDNVYFTAHDVVKFFKKK